MLLQTVVLLLLCVSTGTCATLGHYQSNEEEAPAPVSAAAIEGVVHGAGGAHEGDTIPAEKSTAKTLSGDTLLGKILAVDSTDEEQGTSNDKPASEALTKGPATQEPTSSEEWNEIRPVNTHLDKSLEREDNSWSLNSIRNSFQTVHGYFDSLVELVGGHNGVCEYRCKYGKSEPLDLACYITVVLMIVSLLAICPSELSRGPRDKYSACFQKTLNDYYGIHIQYFFFIGLRLLPSVLFSLGARCSVPTVTQSIQMFSNSHYILNRSIDLFSMSTGYVASLFKCLFTN